MRRQTDRQIVRDIDNDSEMRGDRRSPPELKYGLSVGRNSILGPRQEVELSHCTGFAGLQVLQIETPHEIVVAPDVLRHQMHLIVVVEFAAFFRPIPVTHRHTVLHESSQHDYYDTTLLPYHLQ